MKENREKLGSRLGFILLSAGCAIGCGNVWKFPTMCGQNGGAGFVLIYLLCLVILGLPVMTMEFAIGRASQKSPIKMYQQLEKPKSKWHLHGYVSLFGNIALMAFYTVVTGWMINYFVRFATGNNLGELVLTETQNPFGFMASDLKTNLIFTAVAIFTGFFVLCFKLQGGLERVTKVMMIALLLLLIGLAVYSFTLPGAGDGLKFYLLPDFSKIDGSVIVGAMNQAFFTLSIGMGSMAIFGSYIDKTHSLMGESLTIIGLDTFVAITAGLIIFPACFTYNGGQVDGGPGLLFNTMSTVFNKFEDPTVGRIVGALFFLFMVFAAMSTVFAVCENIVAMLRDLTGWKRPIACLVCGLIVSACALLSILGNTVWTNVNPLGTGSIFDMWDFLVSNNILPLGSLVIALFCCNKRFGWGWENFVAEANAGKGLKVRSWMRPVFRFVVPVLICFIYIYGILSFYHVINF